jgi:ubiquinone/menaquinone biosynthesis C-methylase UbiE
MTQKAAAHLVHTADSMHSYTSPESYVLDVGSGSGVLTRCLAAHFPSLAVVAGAVPPGMLQLIDSAKLRNVSTRFLDASKLEGVEDETFMIQFLSNCQSVDNEMCRVLKPGWFGNMG